MPGNTSIKLAAVSIEKNKYRLKNIYYENNLLELKLLYEESGNKIFFREEKLKELFEFE